MRSAFTAAMRAVGVYPVRTGVNLGSRAAGGWRSGATTGKAGCAPVTHSYGMYTTSQHARACLSECRGR